MADDNGCDVETWVREIDPCSVLDELVGVGGVPLYAQVVWSVGLVA